MKDGSKSGRREDAHKETAEPEQTVVRTSVVDRGRQLLADPAYPGIYEARELARILLPIL
jgi:hypothetical protein